MSHLAPKIMGIPMSVNSKPAAATWLYIALPPYLTLAKIQNPSVVVLKSPPVKRRIGPLAEKSVVICKIRSVDTVGQISGQII